MSQLAVDYVTNPGAAAIKAAGYSGIVRYLSPGANPKNLVPSERDAAHAAGLWILLVFESFTNRALGGAAAGGADGATAAAEAVALGYSPGCPIFYAVDFDAQPSQIPLIHAYGQAFGQHWLAGPYGGIAVINAATEMWRWQTVAWSRGQLSPAADMYQRLAPTLPLHGSFDENVVLNPALPVWGPPPSDPKEHAVLLFQDSTGIYFLTGAGTVHVPTVADVQILRAAGVPFANPLSDAFGASLRGTP